MNRQKFVYTIVILGSFICLLISSKMLLKYYSWAEEKKAISTNRDMLRVDTLRVILIGDSWAAYHHNNDSVLALMIQEKLHKPISVISSGMVGAKTKAIYKLMFDSISPVGTKCLINTKPDYGIIIAGINDAIAKMGTDNYCYHYCLIIRHLLSVGIKPIVLDMPNVDYKNVYNQESIVAKLRHHISSWFTTAPMWSFEEYRKELQLKIHQEGLMDKIIYLSSKEWNPKGFKDPRDLYLDDHVHLTENGYELLDSCIALHICNDYSSIHDSQ